MFARFVIALCLLQVVRVFGAGPLPDYIKKCKIDGSLNDCIKENVGFCKPHLNDGIPELTIPKLSPLTLPKIALESKEFTFQINDFNLFGLGEFDLVDVSMTVADKVSIHLEFNFPNLTSFGTYTINGKLLMLELNGGGKMTANATNIFSKVDVTGKKVAKKGAEYIQVEEGKVSIEWRGQVYGYFDGLFGDRKDLTEATNQVIQDNIMDFAKELQPIIESVVMNVVLGIMKPITNKHPMNELFD